MDLVYGHLGVPIYDTQSKKWHFARSPASTRHIYPLGRLKKATEAAQRVPLDNGIRQLLKAYPEVDHSLFLGLVQESEAVTRLTSQHDPTVSDLVVVGNAVDSTAPESWVTIQYKPLVAVPSGAAGELLKLVILNREHLGWKNNKGFHLKTMTARDGQEGWWKGNGSKIQQLVFAGKEKAASTWLAVRYQGAISLLKPVIRKGMACPSNASGQIHNLPASQLDANHIVTLVSSDACGIPFADVSFNPWNSQQFVTIDQGGHWHIWNLERVIKNKGIWKLVKDSSGSIIEGENLGFDISRPILDGWATVLWVGNANTLVVASRTIFAIFDTKTQHIGRTVPDIQLAKYSDWILDLKMSPVSQSHLLVLTSSRLFLLEIRTSEERMSSFDVATILVSWVHFRDPLDISLSLSAVDGITQGEEPQIKDTIMVALYSRLNDLASIYTFQHSKAAGHASSKFDPCLLPLTETASLLPDLRKNKTDKQDKKAPLGLQLNPVTTSNMRMFEPPHLLDEHTEFFLLRVLEHDLSLSENLYIASSSKARFVEPPDIQKRTGVRKTPATVDDDDFIVPDGVPGDSNLDAATDVKEIHSLSGLKESKQQRTMLPDDDALIDHTNAQTIEMDWLVEEVSRERGDSMPVPFDHCLEFVQDAVTKKLGSVTPGMETLLELGRRDPLVNDIDDAASTVTIMLETIAHSKSTVYDTKNAASESWATISTSLPSQLCYAWGLASEVYLSQLYESLVESQISVLPPKAPGRARVAWDKQLRAVAAQIFLAAHTVSIHTKVSSPVETDEESQSAQDSNFALPVRRKGSEINMSSRGKQAATQYSPPPEASNTALQRLSSQISAKTSALSNANKEFGEDSSSLNLRTLVRLTPQPRLPQKLSNVLSHWRLGEDPATYDWEAAQRATAFPDSEAIVTEQSKDEKPGQRTKKRARNNTGLDDVGKTYVHADGETSSQQEPERRLETRSQAPAVMSSQMPESSHRGAAISSQPLAGRFASGKKAKKGRKSGF